MIAVLTTRFVKPAVLFVALALLAPAMARADPPGYEFMMFPEKMALVVDATGKAPKGVISEETARAITAGAQPASGTSIVLLYQGKIYIVPDKQMSDGKMASDAVKSSAANGGK